MRVRHILFCQMFVWFITLPTTQLDITFKTCATFYNINITFITWDYVCVLRVNHITTRTIIYQETTKSLVLEYNQISCKNSWTVGLPLSYLFFQFVFCDQCHGQKHVRAEMVGIVCIPQSNLALRNVTVKSQAEARARITGEIYSPTFSPWLPQLVFLWPS